MMGISFMFSSGPIIFSFSLFLDDPRGVSDPRRHLTPSCRTFATELAQPDPGVLPRFRLPHSGVRPAYSHH